jgi:hypothetical protein
MKWLTHHWELPIQRNSVKVILVVNLVEGNTITCCRLREAREDAPESADVINPLINATRKEQAHNRHDYSELRNTLLYVKSLP